MSEFTLMSNWAIEEIIGNFTNYFDQMINGYYRITITDKHVEFKKGKQIIHNCSKFQN